MKCCLDNTSFITHLLAIIKQDFTIDRASCGGTLMMIPENYNVLCPYFTAMLSSISNVMLHRSSLLLGRELSISYSFFGLLLLPFRKLSFTED